MLLLTNIVMIEDKDKFYSDFDDTLARGNGLVMVMEDFNVIISESIRGTVGTHSLGNSTNDNGHSTFSILFATTHGLCIVNTFFEHKHIHLAIPGGILHRQYIKDYILVKQRMIYIIIPCGEQEFLGGG